jgi:NitT/TauT family transport system ATP-binding protein
VVVTHDPAEAVRLGRRVLLLSSAPGRVVAEWEVGTTGPPRLAEHITDRLRAEVRAARAEETLRAS